MKNIYKTILLISITYNSNFIFSQNTISFNSGFGSVSEMESYEKNELEKVRRLIKQSDSLLESAISYDVKLGSNPKNVDGEWQFPLVITTKLDPVIYNQFVSNFYKTLSSLSMNNSLVQKYKELNKPVNLVNYFGQNQAPRYANFSSSIQLLNEYKDSLFDNKIIRIYTDQYYVSSSVAETKKYIKSVELQGRSDLYNHWMISIADKNTITYSTCYLANPQSFQLINDYFDNMSKIFWSFKLKNEILDVNGLTLRNLFENHTLNEFSSLSYENKKNYPIIKLCPGLINFDFEEGHNLYEDNFRHILSRSGCCKYGGLQYDLLSPFYKSAKPFDKYNYRYDPKSLSKHWTILDGLNEGEYFNTNFPWGEVDAHLNNYMNSSFMANYSGISLPIPMDSQDNSDRTPAIILGLFPSIDNAILSNEQFAKNLNHNPTMIDKTQQTLESGSYPFKDEDLVKALYLQLNINTITSGLTNISKITLNQKINPNDLSKIKSYSIEKTPFNTYAYPENDIELLKLFMRKDGENTEIPEVQKFVDSIFRTKFEDIFMGYMTPSCLKYVMDVMEVRQGYSEKSEEDLYKLYGSLYDVKNSIFTALLETGNCGWDERKIFSQMYNGELNGGYWYEITLMGRCEGQGYSYQRINLKIQELNGEYKISYFVAKDPY